MENEDGTIIIVEPMSKEDKAERAARAKAQKLQDVADATEARRQAYMRISDPVYMQWKRGLKTEQDWLDAVAQVETDYPIPGEGDE